MTPQKPAGNRQIPFLLSGRITDLQYRGVTFLADVLEISTAEVQRRALDHYLKSQTDVKVGRKRFDTLYDALEAGEL